MQVQRQDGEELEEGDHGAPRAASLGRVVSARDWRSWRVTCGPSQASLPRITEALSTTSGQLSLRGQYERVCAARVCAASEDR